MELEKNQGKMMRTHCLISEYSDVQDEESG